MRAAQALWLAILLLALAGCQMLVQPETAQQRLFILDGQVTAVGETLGDLRQGGVIKDGPYAQLTGVWHQADMAMDAAWIALGKGDLDTVAGQMAVVQRLLYTIRAGLQEATK